MNNQQIYVKRNFLKKYLFPGLLLFIIIAIIFALSACPPGESIPVDPVEVSFTINTEQERTPISPYIYGTNQYLTETEGWTIVRFGGNRTTGYNWETNASNAGEDWYNSSDDFLCSSYNVASGAYNTPGAVLTTFHDKNTGLGSDSIITLQMAGYVSADKDGTVIEADEAPSSRWLSAVAKKDSAFSLPPNSGDDFVYMDECVNFLVDEYGNAATEGGVAGYSLDNEPALWSSTHPRIHPDPAGCNELVEKTILLSTAIKDVDPFATIYGPALYGFAAFHNFQDAPDWDTVKGSYDWFVDYYLDNMEAASTLEETRLLDVLDIHWYPEARGGGERITEGTPGSTEACIARMQAPRTLWDPDYTEDSWIGEWRSDFLPLLPRVQQSIDTYYPGTKLSITEYNYGGENHISGGIAMADVLGIFGKYGVYAACYWQLKEATACTTSAFKAYRNYDGDGGTFGDTMVNAETTDKEGSSVYASVFDAGDTSLHIMAINKNWDAPINATIVISSPEAYTSCTIWSFDSETSQIVLAETINQIDGNTFTCTFPELSVSHIVCE